MGLIRELGHVSHSVPGKGNMTVDRVKNDEHLRQFIVDSLVSHQVLVGSWFKASLSPPTI